MPCELWFLLGLFSIAVVSGLFLHHFFKHSQEPNRLENCDRLFQVRDVFVCCMFERPLAQRCSHELWICIFSVLFIVSYYQLRTHCE